MSRHSIRVVSLGRVAYSSALEQQNAHAGQLLNDNSRSTNTLLILEHEPVYTVGLRSQEYTTDIETKLKSLGADFHRTNRGGLITFHGPGQLVAYPIIDLRRFNLGMKSYVCKLEQTLISMCKKFGLKAGRSEHTGVWIGENKIAAIGIHGKRFVTTHGLALNCDIDLTWFQHIVPCGINGKGVTSLTKELDRQVTISDATIPFLNSFSEVFDCELQFEEETCKIQKYDLT